MSGASELREGDEAPEGGEVIDDYRAEIRGKYPEPEGDRKGEEGGPRVEGQAGHPVAKSGDAEVATEQAEPERPSPENPQGEGAGEKTAEAGEDGERREDGGYSAQSGRESWDQTNAQPDPAEKRAVEEGKEWDGGNRAAEPEARPELQEERIEPDPSRERVDGNDSEGTPQEGETAGRTAAALNENPDAQVSRHENDPPVEEVRQEVPEGDEDDPKATDSRAARAGGADGRKEAVAEGGANEIPANSEEMRRPPDESRGEEKRAPERPSGAEDVADQPQRAHNLEEKGRVEANSQPEQERAPKSDAKESHDAEISPKNEQKHVSIQLAEEGDHTVSSRELKEDDCTPREQESRPAQVRGDDSREAEVSSSLEVERIAGSQVRPEDSQAHQEYITTFEATAREVPRKEGSNIRFDIEKSTFERETGIVLEDGKTYEMTGTIGDDTEFRAIHARNEGRRLYVTVPPEEADKFEVGQQYPLKFRSVEEKRTYTPFEGKEGQVWLQLQKGALESVGIDKRALEGKPPEERVAELTLQNLSHDGESPKRFFTQISSEDGVTLKLARAGVSKDDQLKLEAGRLYEKSDFVQDFETHKSKELANVELRQDGKKMFMQVNGREFELKEHKLDVHGLRVFLKGRIDSYKDDIRFIFDATNGTIETKTGGGRAVTGFVSHERDGLAIRYCPESPGMFVPFHEQLERERWTQLQYQEGIRSLVRDKNFEGTHRFEITNSLHDYIEDRLDKLRPYGKTRNNEIGNIGEDVGSAVLVRMGVTEIERHPFDRRGPGRDSHKHGTDSLQRDSASNNLWLFEFRNWRDSREAAEKAHRDVLKRRFEERDRPRHGKIDGAYIAILNIDMEKRIGKLQVRRVW